MRQITFEDALTETEDVKRSLLIGNGFSISIRPEFSYSSLISRSGIDEGSLLLRLFESLGTTDFEYVARKLVASVQIVELYDHASDLIPRINSDIDRLRVALIEAIANVHPQSADLITDGRATSCADFLSNFLVHAGGGQVYSSNYDLMLYWVVNRHRQRLGTNDGFRGREQLLWKQEELINQNIFYLHGALHLFTNADGSISKLRSDSDRLMNQISENIELGRLPMFVSEGNHNHKLERIRSNQYLNGAYASFSNSCRGGGIELFVYGHALSVADDHLVSAIASGALERIFLSVHNVEMNRHTVAALEARIIAKRQALRNNRDFEIAYFSTDDSCPWS